MALRLGSALGRGGERRRIFSAIYVIFEDIGTKDTAWFALALAALYIFLSRQARDRAGSPEAARTVDLLHLALAIGFITVAIPIRLDAHWITMGWFVEMAVLLWVADRIHSDLLNVFAIGALLLGVGRLLLIDNFYVTRPIFNTRMATYAVAIAVLGAVAWYGSRRKDEAARTVAGIAVVALNLLALIALSREVADYYSREMTGILPQRQWDPAAWTNWHTEIARDFTYSALWMAYGAMLMVVGFWRRSAFVRWQALVLIAFTIGKVFLYDVSELDRGYRIVSFIVLGVLLLAISFMYQRDWLKLSSRRIPERALPAHEVRFLPVRVVLALAVRRRPEGLRFPISPMSAMSASLSPVSRITSWSMKKYGPGRVLIWPTSEFTMANPGAIRAQRAAWRHVQP